MIEAAELGAAFLGGVVVTLAATVAGLRWVSRHPNELLAWLAKRGAR